MNVPQILFKCYKVTEAFYLTYGNANLVLFLIHISLNCNSQNKNFNPHQIKAKKLFPQLIERVFYFL